VPTGCGVPEAVRVPVPDSATAFVMCGVPEAVRVPVPESVTVPGMCGVPEAVRVPVPESVTVPGMCGVPEAVRVPVPESVTVPGMCGVPVVVSVPVPLKVAVPVAPPAGTSCHVRVSVSVLDTPLVHDSVVTVPIPVTEVPESATDQTVPLVCASDVMKV
jgi:hypothetical protein